MQRILIRSVLSGSTNISADENMLVFMRRGTKEQDDLLVVCNFSPLVYENHKIGVPYSGKFKEIFNSDSTEFGGDRQYKSAF